MQNKNQSFQKGLYIPKTFVQEYCWTFARREHEKGQCSRGVCRSLSIIYDGLFCKNYERLLVVYYFWKNIFITSDLW